MFAFLYPRACIFDQPKRDGSELWLRAQDGDLVVEGSGCDEVNGVYKPSSEGNYNGHSWWWKDGVHYRDGSRYGNPENFQVWHNGGQVR